MQTKKNSATPTLRAALAGWPSAIATERQRGVSIRACRGAVAPGRGGNRAVLRGQARPLRGAGGGPRAPQEGRSEHHASRNSTAPPPRLLSWLRRGRRRHGPGRPEAVVVAANQAQHQQNCCEENPPEACALPPSQRMGAMVVVGVVVVPRVAAPDAVLVVAAVVRIAVVDGQFVVVHLRHEVSVAV